MKALIPILLTSVVFLSSCEKSITITLPEEPRKLVLNAVTLRGEPIHATLSRTLSNAESGKRIDASVAGALVLLYRDGQLADALEPVTSGEYLSTVIAEPDHRYKLVVTHSAFPGIEAETEAPARVPITGWNIERDARQSQNYGNQDLLRVRFKDPSPAGDHYVLQILSGYSSIYERELDFYSWDDCINISDPGFESPYASEFPGEESCLPSRSLLLRDIYFNGEEKELKMYGPQSMLQPYYYTRGDTLSTMDTVYPTVLMYHVPADFYRFIKSFRSAWDASGNPFAEPFNVTTNVTGGYGVFAIISEERVEIR